MFLFNISPFATFFPLRVETFSIVANTFLELCLLVQISSTDLSLAIEALTVVATLLRALTVRCATIVLWSLLLLNLTLVITVVAFIIKAHTITAFIRLGTETIFSFVEYTRELQPQLTTQGVGDAIVD